jgi:hypothetical protein
MTPEKVPPSPEREAFTKAAMTLGSVYAAHQDGSVDGGVDNAAIAILEDFMVAYRALLASESKRTAKEGE